MENMITTLAYPEKESKEILARIKGILDRGNIVVFTQRGSSVVKKVKEWNLDSDGDLKAFESTGRSFYVCPVAVGYDITEETKSTSEEK